MKSFSLPCIPHAEIGKVVDLSITYIAVVQRLISLHCNVPAIVFLRCKAKNFWLNIKVKSKEKPEEGGDCVLQFLWHSWTDFEAKAKSYQVDVRAQLVA